jgi:hypothetical protein
MNEAIVVAVHEGRIKGLEEWQLKGGDTAETFARRLQVN